MMTIMTIPTWMIKKLHVAYRNKGIDEDARRALIHRLTNGRTDSTKGLTYSEAQYILGFLEGTAQGKVNSQRITTDAVKKLRSAVLKRLQQIGIDTTDWDAVNAYLRSPKIAGHALYELSGQELSNLIPKLESIKRKQNEA